METGNVRIDLALEGEPHDLGPVSRAITAAGGEVVSLGVYPDAREDRTVVSIEARAIDPDALVESLAEQGFRVLGVHDPARPRST